MAPDLAERATVPGNHEPPAQALVRITAKDVVVHAHAYLDATGSFDL